MSERPRDSLPTGRTQRSTRPAGGAVRVLRLASCHGESGGGGHGPGPQGLVIQPVASPHPSPPRPSGQRFPSQGPRTPPSRERQLTGSTGLLGRGEGG